MIDTILQQLEQARQHAVEMQIEYRKTGENEEAEYWLGAAVGFNGAKQIVKNIVGAKEHK